MKESIVEQTKLQSLVIDTKEPKVTKDNEVYLDGVGLLKINGTKLKYFKNGDYNNFMIIKTVGVSELMRYEDGDEVLKSFIGAVLDIPKSEITFLDELQINKVNELIDKANAINGIKETDFLNQMAKKAVEEV